MPNTIRLHRVLRTAPEKLYRAFLEPDAMAKWLPPNGFTCKIHEMNARVGGTYKMSFTNFTTGPSHSFGGTYVKLVPHETIQYVDRFDDPNLPGENPRDGPAQEGFFRNRTRRCPRRRTRRNSRRGVLSGLTGIPRTIRAACRTRHSRVAVRVSSFEHRLLGATARPKFKGTGTDIFWERSL